MVAPRVTVLEPDYRRRLHAQGGVLSRSDPSLDIALVALPFVALLFNLIIGPLTVLLMLTTIAAFMVLRYERLYALFASTWPLLLVPLFCMLSVLWSEQPTVTLRYGTLYLATVLVALIVGAGTSRVSALKAIQIAFSLYLFASILLGRWVVWLDGSYAFAGLAGSKNAAADIAGIGLVVSTATLCWAGAKRAFRWGLLAFATAPAAVYCLVFAKSTGALLATGLALGCLLSWIISRRLAPMVRMLFFLLGIVSTLVILATTPLWMEPVFQTVLESSGKDRTLTGRTDLWRVADQYVANAPILGIGYSAFWVPDNPDAKMLWRLLGVPIGSPFNFHNTFRAVAVEIGIAGLLLYALTLILCSIKLLWRSIVRPDYYSLFLCTILVFVAPRLYFEVLGFTNMQISTVLIFAAFASSLRLSNVSHGQQYEKAQREFG